MSKSLEELKSEFNAALEDDYEPREVSQLFRIFYEEVLDVSQIQAITESSMVFSEPLIQKFYRSLERLKKLEPHQYIFNKADFRGLEFYVDENVLIPRPETEELVSEVLKVISSGNKLLDLGTGSGCIPVSIKTEFPDCQIWALDVSASAIDIARRNATFHEVEIDFMTGSMDSKLKTAERFDILISNPPYIGIDEKSLLKDNVLSYEPGIALFSITNDPLYFYRQIELRARESLKTGGFIFLELHENYANQTEHIFHTESYKNTSLINDLQGKQRILKVEKY